MGPWQLHYTDMLYGDGARKGTGGAAVLKLMIYQIKGFLCGTAIQEE